MVGCDNDDGENFGCEINLEGGMYITRQGRCVPGQDLDLRDSSSEFDMALVMYCVFRLWIVDAGRWDVK